MNYAGFWIRSAAILIDTVLFVIGFMLASLVLDETSIVFNAVYQLICLAYYIGFIMSKHQGSLGQMILKLKVVNLQGHKITLGQAFLRYFLWTLPAIPMIALTFLPFYPDSLEKINNVDPYSQEANLVLESPDVQFALLSMMIASGIMVVLGIIWFLFIGLNQEKAGIHDRLSKTRVVKIKDMKT